VMNCNCSSHHQEGASGQLVLVSFEGGCIPCSADMRLCLTMGGPDPFLIFMHGVCIFSEYSCSDCDCRPCLTFFPLINRQARRLQDDVAPVDCNGFTVFLTLNSKRSSIQSTFQFASCRRFKLAG
jgi:hypothetical protein